MTNLTSLRLLRVLGKVCLTTRCRRRAKRTRLSAGVSTHMKDMVELAQELEKLLHSFTERDRALLKRRFGVTLSYPPRASDFANLTSAQIEEVEKEALKKLGNPE